MAETEKVTINMSVVDLGKVDLLVDQGFYSSRTDFIRTAIRNQLAGHAEAVQQTVTRRTMVVGVVSYSRQELEAVRARGEKLAIRVVGLLTFADDVSPELALATIESIELRGVLRAGEPLRAALSPCLR